MIVTSTVPTQQAGLPTVNPANTICNGEQFTDVGAAKLDTLHCPDALYDHKEVTSLHARVTTVSLIVGSHGFSSGAACVHTVPFHVIGAEYPFIHEQEPVALLYVACKLFGTGLSGQHFVGMPLPEDAEVIDDVVSDFDDVVSD